MEGMGARDSDVILDMPPRELTAHLRPSREAMIVAIEATEVIRDYSRDPKWNYQKRNLPPLSPRRGQ